MLLSLSALLKPKPLLHPAGHPHSAQQGFHQLETIPLLTALFTTLPLYPMQVLFPSNFLLSHLSCTFCSVRFHIQNLFFLHFDVSLSIYTLLMLKINTFDSIQHPTVHFDSSSSFSAPLKMAISMNFTSLPELLPLRCHIHRGNGSFHLTVA